MNQAVVSWLMAPDIPEVPLTLDDFLIRSGALGRNHLVADERTNAPPIFEDLRTAAGSIVANPVLVASFQRHDNP
jgi:hypothetical protein